MHLKRTAVAQTSFLGLGGLYLSWMEAGWRERVCSGGYSGHCFYAFAEWGINGNPHSNNERTYACLTPGSTKKWQVVNVPATYDWNTWLDCNDGTGWRLLFQYTGTGYSKGTPAGEGARRGTNTTMGEVHKNLHWQDATNTWNSPSDVSCWVDVDTGWDGSKVTNDKFAIVSGTSSC